MQEQETNKIISITEPHARQKVSRIDFEILANFYRICKKKGISEREVSFLLGKYNKYFVEILNPFGKEHIKTEFLDMLPAIASTSFRQIIPNTVKPNETLDIDGTYNFYSDRLCEVTYYKFTVTYDDDSSKNFRWKIEATKGGRAKINKDLLDTLKGMVAAGYFDNTKFALTIYLHLKKAYKSRYTPLEIQIALAKLCNKKAETDFALEEDTENSRVVYMKKN
ncbi:hypothetical protein FXV77_20680 [Sphingobacterium phlebotomi]|uniref:Uncharacterized protein n=1 Tax=Sphingobacterium phlebotomi TaxID=2605433 RepID=A0A5D4GS61_9SPHI|nr:hypothetical protein [Sphingobacterium phlebotomi]TYR31661.1 hypothetical protein FXV77_20680 [Sphingobacterium phlebotomi]